MTLELLVGLMYVEHDFDWWELWFSDYGLLSIDSCRSVIGGDEIAS